MVKDKKKALGFGFPQSGMATGHSHKTGNVKRFALYPLPFTLFFALVILSGAKNLLAQQPSTAAPVFRTNAAWVQGIGPGYRPTAGAGLTLNLAAGTAYCGSPPVAVAYAGGTLTMTDAATNYVFLDPAAACVPASNTTGFAEGHIPLAAVVTSGGAITSVTDRRTWFTPLPCSMSSTGAITCAALGTNQNITLTPSGTGAVTPRNIAPNVNTVTFSATPTFDASLGNTQKITLTANVTSSTLSNATTGQTINFIICQDSTGSRTFVWPTNVLGGMTIGATASKCSAQTFIFDGTNAYALSAGVINM